MELLACMALDSKHLNEIKLSLIFLKELYYVSEEVC